MNALRVAPLWLVMSIQSQKTVLSWVSVTTEAAVPGAPLRKLFVTCTRPTESVSVLPVVVVGVWLLRISVTVLEYVPTVELVTSIITVQLEFAASGMLVKLIG